jgi:O-methyltransferase
MYSYLSHEFFADGGKPIDYFEFGVHRGDSLRTWTTLNVNPQTRFFGFDSFEGLPEDWNEKKTKGTFGTGGKTPDISDPRVQFVVGWFQNVVPGFLKSYEPKNPLVLHNDSDLYSSTLYCLTAMNSLMPRETIVIFDEFYDALHEYRALVDYASAYMRQFKIVAATRRFDQVAIAIL